MNKKLGREMVIETRKIKKVYNKGLESEITVLKGIDLKIFRGDFVVVMGPSGSGKTTLLDIMGCLLKPTHGTLLIGGKEVNGLSDSELAHIRGEKIGFVFQQYNLIPSGTAIDNVELSMRINGKGRNESRKRAIELLKMVGLEKRMTHKPGELSGGEQQRVAIARALANNPSIILADEPTGNLDTKTGQAILDVLKRLNKKKGYSVILISHDPGVVKYADKVIKIRDGEIMKRL